MMGVVTRDLSSKIFLFISSHFFEKMLQHLPLGFFENEAKFFVNHNFEIKSPVVFTLASQRCHFGPQEMSLYHEIMLNHPFQIVIIIQIN